MDINLVFAKNSLLGTAMGDSLGLPYEGLSPQRGQKLMPFPLRQRLLGRRGTVSDDTVQSALVLGALQRCDGSEAHFQKLLATGLRNWFLSIPPGIGIATIKACSKLCVGIPPSRSGVSSAGNGAAMRAAVIGAALSKDPEARQRFVAASSRVTHTHPDAITGAQLVALAAALHAHSELSTFDLHAQELAPNWKWDLKWGEKGPSGYVIHTVNAAMSICRTPNITLEQGIEQAVGLGGDTDTIAAIIGGILGSTSDLQVGNREWQRYFGWPSPTDINHERLKVSYIQLLSQHLIALPAILAFGLRRLLPPY